MNPCVYIPSRGRPENVAKLVKAWEAERFDVVFMVEPDEWRTYRLSVPEDGFYGITVTVDCLPDRNLGVGYSRATCVEHAKAKGHETIILSDDDIRPITGMKHLIEAAEHPLALGITSYHSYLDLALGVKGKYRNDVIVAHQSFMRMWAINISNVEAIGGFDKNLKCIDDNELKFRAAMNGFPWMIHFGAKSASFGKRFAAGGVSSLGNRAVENAADRIVDKHRLYSPEFIRRVDTPKAIQYKWSKIHDHFLPNWRDWSEKHGGSVDNYLGGKQHRKDGD